MRETHDNWQKKCMELAFHIAGWSKDRSRKCGAVIVGDQYTVISVGYNGFPKDSDDNVEARHQRPAKYKWTEHAERNAIYNAALKGVSTSGASMFLNWYPCCDCARAIIQCGIDQLVCMEPQNLEDPTWAEDFRVTKEMFKESYVQVEFFDKSKLSPNLVLY